MVDKKFELVESLNLRDAKTDHLNPVTKRSFLVSGETRRLLRTQLYRDRNTDMSKRTPVIGLKTYDRILLHHSDAEYLNGGNNMSKLVFTVESYDYFRRNDAHRFETEIFDNIVEGYKAYKKSLSHDYNYGDAFRYTRELKLISPEITPERVNRWHARSKEDWEELLSRRQRNSQPLDFDEDEISYLLSLIDEDIII